MIVWLPKDFKEMYDQGLGEYQLNGYLVVGERGKGNGTCDELVQKWGMGWFSAPPLGLDWVVCEHSYEVRCT